eukprot:UN14868
MQSHQTIKVSFVHVELFFSCIQKKPWFLVTLL